MMKKLTTALMILIVTFFMVTASQAFYYDDVNVGDTVKMTSFLGATSVFGSNHSANGFMNMQDVTTSATWKTFCTDEDTNIVQGTSHTVSSLGNPNSYLTAYLYWNVRNDSLTGWTGTDNQQREMQLLIWNLEDDKTYTLNSEMTTWLSAANSAAWTDYHGIKILNLGSGVQTTLVATPIPGALWLLGSGLIGMIGIRRRRHQTV